MGALNTYSIVYKTWGYSPTLGPYRHGTSVFRSRIFGFFPSLMFVLVG